MQDEATEIVISQRDFQLKRMEETRAAIHQARETGNWDRVPADVYRKLLANISITTLSSVQRREIMETIDVITTQSLCTATIPGLPDPGAVSKEAERLLQETADRTLLKLREQALKLHADAVVDVKTSHQLVTATGDQYQFLIVCTGTAVKLD